jgi:3-phenylpropionate/trans-cinnamate dioxygenase ferredoxin reductase component
MSDDFELLIIGGGPAGLAAARAYRERCHDGEVAIVADEHRMPYERPPLTKELLRGELGFDELAIEDEDWLTEQRVRLISGRAVTLDPGERTIDLSGGRRLSYVTCLLATGAEPTRLPIPGADHPRVRVVRTADHVRELLERLIDGARVTVIGSGFIGCEIAASLRMRGHPVELVSDEAAPNAARLGDEAAAIIREWLREDGVALALGTPVDRIEPAGDAATVIAGERRIDAGVVVMASGVTPRSELAVQAGLELDHGAIAVDASMRSARDGVLAAGDVCKALNVTAGRTLRVEHWGDALAQGEIAGATAAGADGGWDSVPGFWSTIGARTLKYAAWGDGYDETRLQRHHDGGFTAWYGAGGRIVGVLTHDADEDYERGRERIALGARWTW